ncbi:MAG: preprotein translocase subunit SecE [Proteobacteria bacterium]|nr:preprotein translocase subunit SecE [Cystobacterineae bacterium]MCL2258417.1 preprotein translocase subunit SecE [Cystobacterineae bacterium]MCL2315330.1 preprotein translocase subunit SecE [Pseudomonadota bacterium]
MSANEASEKANRAGMDAKRLLVIVFLVLGSILALFFGHLLGLLWGWAGWADREIFEGLPWWSPTSVLGFVLAGGVVAWVYFSKEPRAYAEEAASELMRVVWPSFAEVRVSTLAVIVTAFVAAFFLFFADSLSYELMVEWLPRLWERL